MSRGRVVVRATRLVGLACAAWLLHLASGGAERPLGSDAVTLEQARTIFPAAARLAWTPRLEGCQRALDADGELLGFVARTSPQADGLIGYSGSSDVLVGLDGSGRILGADLLRTGDTVAHAEAVRASAAFWQSLRGWAPTHQAPPEVEAVSGSTLTSLALVEGIALRFRSDGGRRDGSARVRSLRFPDPVSLEEARELFPSAGSLDERVLPAHAAVVDATGRPVDRWWLVLSEEGGPLGYLVRTAPHADNVRGYRGPTEALVAIDLTSRWIVGVRVRGSYDTPEYVDRVREDDAFLRSLTGREDAEWAEIDFRAEGIEGVSGATQTSFALVEGIRRRFAADLEPVLRPETPAEQLRSIALAALCCLGVGLTFSPWRRNRRLRRAWQLVLVLGFGFVLGDLLSLALFAGQARAGILAAGAPALFALSAVALLVPWGSRRNPYCHNLCPHGAVQEWVGAVRRFRKPLPVRVHRVLRLGPFVTLGVAFLLALLVPEFDLSLLEPFDAWSLGLAAAIPLAIAVGGVVACLFVPMAYCRYGCPTGAVFALVRSHGSDERLTRRDGSALALLGVAAIFLWGTRGPAVASTEPSLRGGAFGTSWSVRLREPLEREAEFRLELVDQLEGIESSLSSWRPSSEVASVNESETTLSMEVSEELHALLAHGQALSAATAGDFDLTIGPLVDAWGVGPAGRRDAEPSSRELSSLLERTGWEKLQLEDDPPLLRKAHPELRIDLGALLHGYAADRLAETLDSRGIEEYLIEVGGELRARGRWTVAIEDPADPERVLRTLTLEDAALATSGAYREPAHLISPATGRPVDSPWTLCSVIAPTALEADGWSTALLVSGARAEEVAREHGVRALLLDATGAATTAGSWPED